MQSILICDKSLLSKAVEVRRRLAELDQMFNQPQGLNERLQELYTAIVNMIPVDEFLGYLPGPHLPIS